MRVQWVIYCETSKDTSDKCYLNYVVLFAECSYFMMALVRPFFR